MTKGKALTLAIDAMRKQRQTFAFDANIAEKMPDGAYLRGGRAKKEYDELTQAILVLQDMRGE